MRSRALVMTVHEPDCGLMDLIRANDSHWTERGLYCFQFEVAVGLGIVGIGETVSSRDQRQIWPKALLAEVSLTIEVADVPCLFGDPRPFGSQLLSKSLSLCL